MRAGCIRVSCSEEIFLYYADISYGIKLGNLNVGHENDIYTFPYFCAFKLKAYLRNRDR